MNIFGIVLLVVCGCVKAQEGMNGFFLGSPLDEDVRDNRILGTMDPFISEGPSEPKPNVPGSCGGIIKQSSGAIASPNFDAGDYPPDRNCTWVLEVEEGKLMKLKFTYMDMEVDPPECPFDGVLLLDYGEIEKPEDTEAIVQKGILGNLKVPPTVLGEQKFCGYEQFEPMSSISNTVFVYFYSDFDGTGGGFALEWETIETPEDAYDCDFESGPCQGWVNIDTDEDVFDWSTGEGATGTPLTDHTLQTKDGKYMYVESLAQEANDTAVLSTPDILFGENEATMCLDFWYNMKGGEVGTLAVGLGVKDDRQVVWMMQGDQGESWNHALIEIESLLDPFRIMFVAIIGGGINGDIAIDDVKLHRSACADIVSVETTTEIEYTTSLPTTEPIVTTDYEEWSFTTNAMTTDYEYSTFPATTEPTMYGEATTESYTTEEATTTDIVTTEAEETTADAATTESYEFTTESFEPEFTTDEQTTMSMFIEETTFADETTVATETTTTSTVAPTTSTTIPTTTTTSTSTSTHDFVNSTPLTETTQTPDVVGATTTKSTTTEEYQLDITTENEPSYPEVDTTTVATVANVHTTARGSIIYAPTTRESIHEPQDGVSPTDSANIKTTTGGARVSKFSLFLSTACMAITYAILSL